MNNKSREIKQLIYISGVTNQHISSTPNQINLIYKFKLITQDNNVFEVHYIVHYPTNITFLQISEFKIEEKIISYHYDNISNLDINFNQKEAKKLQTLIREYLVEKINNHIFLYNTIDYNITLKKENIEKLSKIILP